MPIPTAMIRSKDTVIRAVTMKTIASDLPEPTMLRTVAIDTIRTAVTISTPASAASGIAATAPEAR